MTLARTVRAVLRGAPPHWVGDGFFVSNVFPTGNDLQNALSPFFLLDYQPPLAFAPDPNAATRTRGIGAHPHRGFEAVILSWEGAIAHHDSEGNAGIVGPGDVQWMTAASGVLHKEHHEAGFAAHGGTLHMAQLWVNLPRAHKMGKPGYQSFRAGDVGEVILEGGAGRVRVIAGSFRGVRGPARTFTKIDLWDVELARAGRLDLEFPERENVGLFVVRGAVTIAPAGQAAGPGELVVFANDGDAFAVSATCDAHFLLMNGEPIDEPAVQYGPFLMNSDEELRQAVADYEAGKFGTL
jgi:redox-sensitive bicupin YhaK (pirin superfamily)